MWHVRGRREKNAGLWWGNLKERDRLADSVCLSFISSGQVGSVDSTALACRQTDGHVVHLNVTESLAAEDFVLLNSTTSLSILEVHLPLRPPNGSPGLPDPDR
jgi:hypothetical protein